MEIISRIRSNKRLNLWLQTIISLAVMGYLAVYIYQRWQEVDVVSLSLSWPLLAGSAAALTLFYLFFSRSWRRTLTFVNADLADFHWLALHRVFIYAFLTRYLPAGNVVTIGSRVGFYKALGGSGSKGFESVYHEQIYLTLGAFVLSAAALGAAPAQALPALAATYRWPLVAGLLLSVVGLGLATDWVLEVVSRVIPIAAMDHLGELLSLSEKAEMLGRFIVVNIFQGTAAYLGVWAIYPELAREWQSVLLVLAAYPMSRFVGQVAAVVPGGLGVREGAFAFILGSFLPVQPLIIGAGIIRLLSVFIELINAGFLFIWSRRVGIKTGIADGKFTDHDQREVNEG